MNNSPEQPSSENPPLSHEELAQLHYDDAGNPVGIRNPVALEPFKTLDEFIQHEGNFPAYFTFTAETILGRSYRGSNVFLRFQALNPDLESDLSARLQGKGYRDWGRADWERLYVAHQKMSQLVDRDDPGVVKNGEIDTQYLRH